MKLQTQIPLKKCTENTISYNSQLVLFGSCFSEHIGDKLHQYKFQTSSNPFGILFHPKAIENLISKSLSDFTYKKDDVFKLNEQFQCFDAHSKLNTLNDDELVLKLNSSLKETKNQLKKASHIVITPGTSWIYKHIEKQLIVANCHKVPQKEFSKELLSINEISKTIQSSIDAILKTNTKAQFIFTVSPIRHVKDGFTENTLSKAHLITAIHQIISKNKNASYFPSYEIMMDELRDYRFYNEDLLHPNTSAINYIWDRFCETWMTKETLHLKKEISHILNGLNHKPFNKNSEAHRKFVLQLQRKQDTIIKKLPHVSF